FNCAYIILYVSPSTSSSLITATTSSSGTFSSSEISTCSASCSGAASFEAFSSLLSPHATKKMATSKIDNPEIYFFIKRISFIFENLLFYYSTIFTGIQQAESFLAEKKLQPPLYGKRCWSFLIVALTT